MRRRRWALVVASVLGAGGLAACSGSSDDTATPTTGTLAVGRLPDAPEESPPPVTEPPRSSLPLGPEPTGVPGLDSDDPFCRSYSRFTGSAQALANGAAFGGLTPEAIARLEVLAAPTVSRAAASLLERWPTELAGERDVIADRVLGPLARRAGWALDELQLSGVDAAGIAEIESAWLGALAGIDDELPVPRPGPLGPERSAQVDRTAAAVAQALVPVNEDPTLVRTDVVTPLTDDYVARTCPDVAPALGDDAI